MRPKGVALTLLSSRLNFDVFIRSYLAQIVSNEDAQLSVRMEPFLREETGRDESELVGLVNEMLTREVL